MLVKLGAFNTRHLHIPAVPLFTSMRFGSAIVQLLIHKCASAVLTHCPLGRSFGLV